MKQPTRSFFLLASVALLLIDRSAGFTAKRAKGVFLLPSRRIDQDVQRDTQRHVDRSTANPEQQSPLALHLSLPRGGAVSPFTATTTAKLCSGFLLTNGIALILTPILWTQSLYKIGINKDSMERYLLEAIGVLSVGMGINVFLSILQNVSAQRAIGLALLPRLLYVLNSFLCGTFDKVGATKNVMMLNTLLITWVTFALLTGAGRPMVAAKIFSSLGIVKGALLTVSPVFGVFRFVGLDIAQEGFEKSRALSKALGNYVLTSAVMMDFIAFGMNPVQAAGYTSLLWTLLLVDMGFITKAYKLMGETSPLSQIIHICIAAAFAAGFLMGYSK